MQRQRHSDILALRCARRAPVLATATPETLEQRLRHLLSWLHFWRHNATDDLSSQTAEAARNAPERDGALSALRWWHRHRNGASDAVRELGAAVRAGDLEDAAERLSVMSLKWLRPSRTKPVNDSSVRVDTDLERGVARAAAFLADALTPWDFDRREPALTFVSSWTDDLRAEPGTADEFALVKLASTVKPLHGEWKLTGRTQLFPLGAGGSVIGKAGIYLAGDAPAYVGVEADRVIALPWLPRTRLFVNANYRSSRVPFAPPVVASAGVQHTFALDTRLDLTFRVGVSTRQADKPWFFSPMPQSSYF